MKTSGHRSIVDYPARFAEYHPSKSALVSDGVDWSYDELNRRVHRTALWLTEGLGLERGDRVAVLAMNHPVLFELLFACIRSGLVLAPLNYRLAPRELDAVLALSGPGVLLADETFHGVACSLDYSQRHLVHSLEQLLEAPEDARQFTGMGAQAEEPVVALFTSGTTGLPKAALLPARQLFFNAVHTQTVFELTRSDSTLVYTPLFHTGGLNVLAMPLFHCGGTVHIHREFKPQRVLEAILESGISTIFGVPTTFEMIASQADLPRLARAGVHLCLCGGAPLPLSLIHRYRDAGLLLTQGFGMTEVGPNCFYLPSQDALERAGSVGRPMPYAEAEIRVNGRAALPDEVGQLWLRGPHVFLGYLGNPEATAESFDGDGWFGTGDLARRDADGFFHVAGRQKEMFISGGENVYPAEVEVALANIPGVKEACVVPVPDPRWGEVGFAFVVTRFGEEDPESVRTQLRELLAPYKIPKKVRFVAELPRNSSGKVVKKTLQEEAIHV